MWPASWVHCGITSSERAAQTPSGAICSRVAFSPLPLLVAPDLLYEGTNISFFMYSPPLPACTQCAAVHTRLLLPGWLGSLTTVPEHTMLPSGLWKKILPTTAVSALYGCGCGFAGMVFGNTTSFSEGAWASGLPVVTPFASESFFLSQKLLIASRSSGLKPFLLAQSAQSSALQVETLASAP